MFTLSSHHNPHLRLGQNSLHAVLSVGLPSGAAVVPAPLALGIALDRSGSMEGPKMKAARDAAIKVVQALDESMAFMVVTFNERPRTIYGPAMGTVADKRLATEAIQGVYADGGTAMSTALNAVVDVFGPDQTRAKQILFLTDGKNEGERRYVLDEAIRRCTQSNVTVNAWGVGTDWDEAELRAIADQTHGSADIIPSAHEVEAAFATAFNYIRRTAATEVRLGLWMPLGVAIRQIQQVYPSIVPLTPEDDPANPRRQFVSLGSFAVDDQRDYLLDLVIPSYPPGQQFVLARPSLHWVQSNEERELASERRGWVLAEWTRDEGRAAQIDPYVAHYTNQEELSVNVREGQAALLAGDNERATRLLGKALELSERTGNEHMTRLLGNLVRRDGYGTLLLNQQANAVDRKTLAINSGKTTRLK